MSFGLQNLGVINQKDAPAIWESDVADFPTTFVKGRILIDTFQGGIYLDTSTTRIQIQASGSGAINYANGVETFGSATPTTSNVGLGGSLTRDTNIDITIKRLFLQGTDTTIIFNTQGAILDDSNTSVYLSAVDSPLIPVVPNCVLAFFDRVTGLQYNIQAYRY